MYLEVWAPRANTCVDIAMDDSLRPMHRRENGWWNIDLPGVGAGIDYGFCLDGGPRLPDPRSPWQPYGVDGPSRLVDHHSFPWQDRQWQTPPLSAALIYELHLGTFTPEGTYAAAAERLDHLVDLGVTHVELMPVAEFSGTRGWGYDGVCLYAPYHHYGEPDDLKRLVNACHGNGLGVILDVVYNHLGPQGNYLPQFGPYFTDRHHTAWGQSLNYDGPFSDEVRRYLCDNALMWLRDYHFDGLRLDAVHAIVDTSAIPFLEQLATEVDELKAHLGRHLVLIAESDLNDPRVVRPWQIGGYGIDAQWSDDVHHALHGALTGERSGYYADFGKIEDVATAMQRPYVYAGRHSRYRRRSHGRSPEGLSAHNFVCFLQNHDQLGNRAQGERIGHLVRPERARIGAALTLLSPFVPMLFQGEEWGATSPFQYFVDYADHPDLARAVTEGRRHEFEAFGWRPDAVPDPQAEETFLRSKLDWSELEREEHRQTLEWHKQLVRFRRQWPELTDGRMDLVSTQFDEAAQWLQVHRRSITIVCNFADEEQSLRLRPDKPQHLLLASREGVVVRRGKIVMPGESVAVLGARGPFPASEELAHQAMSDEEEPAAVR